MMMMRYKRKLRLASVTSVQGARHATRIPRSDVLSRRPRQQRQERTLCGVYICNTA